MGKAMREAIGRLGERLERRVDAFLLRPEEVEEGRRNGDLHVLAALAAFASSGRRSVVLTAHRRTTAHLRWSADDPGPVLASSCGCVEGLAHDRTIDGEDRGRRV
jgi:hypothetical protein